MNATMKVKSNRHYFSCKSRCMQQRSVTPGHTRSGSSHSGLGRTRRRCRILPLELWPVGSSPDRHTWADGICPHDTPPPAMGTSFLNTELWKINQIYLKVVIVQETAVATNVHTTTVISGETGRGGGVGGLGREHAIVNGEEVRRKEFPSPNSLYIF